MDFNTKQLLAHTDDPFYFEKFFTILIFEYRFIRTVLAACATLHLLKNCAQTWYLVHNSTYFLRFGPSLCGETYAIAACVAILALRRTAQDLFGTFPFWSFNSAGEKMERKIRQMTRNSRIVLNSMYILLCTGFALGLMPSELDRALLFPLFLFNEHWPKELWWFSLIYKATLAPLYYAAFVHPLMLVFGTQHVNIQYHLLNELMKNLCWEVDVDDRGNEMYSVEYQNVIRERLRFCVERHVRFLQYGYDINGRLIKPAFMTYLIFGYFGVVGIIVVFMGWQLQMFKLTVRDIILLGTLTSFIFALFWMMLYSGECVQQMVYTDHSNATLLWESWYKWDRRNKETILLMGWQKNFRLEFSDTLAINFELGLSFMKGIYSLFAVIYYMLQ